MAIISLLIHNGEADFNPIKKKNNATSGNISTKLAKLKSAGYIDVIKTFRNNYPLTLSRIIPKGITAFENYVEAIKTYIEPETDQ